MAAEVLMVLVLVFLGLLGVYVVARLISHAIFKSKAQAGRKNRYAHYVYRPKRGKE